jgi:Flp pilus assembly pilin Flp
VNLIRRLLTSYADQQGVAVVEYGLSCALVPLAVVISFAALEITLNATRNAAPRSL